MFYLQHKQRPDRFADELRLYKQQAGVSLEVKLWFLSTQDPQLVSVSSKLC